MEAHMSGHTTADELQFLRTLKAKNPEAFWKYCETVHLRAYWGQINRHTIFEFCKSELAHRPHATNLQAKD